MTTLRTLAWTALLSTSSLALGQGITPLYELAGHPTPAPTHALAISDDGSVVVGYEQDRTFPQRNYPRVWKRSAGFVTDGTPTPPVNRYGQWHDASADGSVLVGTIGSQAYAWRADLGLFRLTIPGTVVSSDAIAISADGSTIGGDYYDNVALRPLVWTFAAGRVPSTISATYSWVNALDDDGSLAVGAADACGFAWARPSAPVFTCDGADTRACHAVTRTGELIFGVQYGDMPGDPNATSSAFRWPLGGAVENLGAIPGARWTNLLSAADSGELAVGWTSQSDYAEIAIVWTRADGFMALADYLDGAGVDVSGWSFTSARDVSPDGRYIVGVGVWQGRVCGFLAELPAGGCAADFNGDSTVDFFDYLDFVAAFDLLDPAADFNGDEIVDFFDYLDFAAAFDVGCG